MLLVEFEPVILNHTIKEDIPNIVYSHSDITQIKYIFLKFKILFLTIHQVRFHLIVLFPLITHTNMVQFYKSF